MMTRQLALACAAGLDGAGRVLMNPVILVEAASRCFGHELLFERPHVGEARVPERPLGLAREQPHPAGPDGGEERRAVVVYGELQPWPVVHRRAL